MRSQKSASEYLVLHATRLGLDRWRQGPIVQATQAAPAMPQADWHAAAQQHFMDWLGAGGFGNENSGNDAAVLMPHCGAQCEELKFSRVRISDAVE
jgi:hypothetical protein